MDARRAQRSPFGRGATGEPGIVRAEQEKRWLEENREAIASINSFIDRHGLLASKLRYRPDAK